MINEKEIRPIPFWKSFIMFFVPTLYFLIIANMVIPYFNGAVGMHPALSWFYGGFLLFVPLFASALILYRLEGRKIEVRLVLDRFRIKRLTKNDWKWTAALTALILVLTGLIMLASGIAAEYFGIRELQTTPEFLKFETLKGYERLYLFIWLPMFFFNIVGEGMLWQGYFLPRQEKEHGKYAWIANSVLWLMFHISFGIDLMIVLLPVLIIIPYMTQKTGNTTTGIIAHAVLNGPMFVMISLGLI